MLKPFLIILFFGCLLISGDLFGQSAVTGRISDKKEKTPLFGARILLTNPQDSTFRKGAYTTDDGLFRIEGIPAGSYQLVISLLGYSETTLDVDIEASQVKDLGVIALSTDVQLIDEITVGTKMIRVEQNGDTTAYNADAYKTNPDATIEDLVTKMPGITVENGVVKAHGEEVKKVLIDGEEFFGDDASAALKNLPAEMVAKIQVYDKLSDQAEFSGVSDGEDIKALNIVTRPGMNAGQFGKLYAGYGTDDHYLAGGNLNFFNGTRRISIIGMSNNVNQQNFSNEDILGVLGSDQSSASGGRQGRGGSGGTDNFLIGQQNGISQTHSFGINYSDKWGKKTKVSGSYFFNNSLNTASTFRNRNYILSNNAGQQYTENNGSESTNFNHRANLKIQYDINSNNSLTFSPRISVQKNNSLNHTDAFTMSNDTSLLNTLLNDKNNRSDGYNLSSDLLYRHRFAKKGRSFSTSLKGSYSTRSSATSQYSMNEFYDLAGDSTSLINQYTDALTTGYSFSSRINYDEPIGESGTLQFSYAPNYNVGVSDKRTNQYDAAFGEYRLLDTLLSSTFDNTTTTQRAGIGYRYKKGKSNFNLELNYDNTRLHNQQEFPVTELRTVSFNNLLPMASFKYDFSKTSVLRFFYRTSTRNPSVNQLQNVIDNSNPLSLKSGNEDLKQQYDHRFIARYNLTNTQKASSFFVYAIGEYNSRYITNATLVATADTVLQDGIILAQGSQYTQPVNLEGSWSVRSFISYGVPVSWLKSNLNFNLGGSYTVKPGLINNQINQSATTNMNSGLTLGSNISEKIDFTITYSINYNIVDNSTQQQSNNQYLIHNESVRFNWLPFKRVVFNTALYANAYSGLGSSFNQSVFLWNAGVGYKFLKQQQLEFRISVYDLLNENTSISRNVTESYIEDVQTQVLQRYLMATLTWNLKNFKGKDASR